MRRDFILSGAIDNYSAKLAKRFDGPYMITKILSPRVYELQADTDNSQNLLGRGFETALSMH